MTDIFFSYSAKDRERVRPVHAALTAMGFDVFWDQAVPAGIDWDTWIRQHLNRSKCAVVFWSTHSIVSDNVRHEATVAKQHGKLIPVMLETLSADQFPMGLYAVQGANLSAWIGDLADSEWTKLQREVEDKLTPKWVRRVTDSLEAELVAERSRREAAERRDKTLRDQIAKEAQAQQELRRELDQVREQLAAATQSAQVAPSTHADAQIFELRCQLEESEKQRRQLEREIADAKAKFRTTISSAESPKASASSPPPRDFVGYNELSTPAKSSLAATTRLVGWLLLAIFLVVFAIMASSGRR